MPASLRHAALARRVRLVCAGVEDRLDLVDDGQHVGEGGVRRGRTHSDYVRRPKSTTTPRSVSASLSRSRVGVFEGDVAATGHMFAGRPDRDLGEPVVDQGDQEVRERERLSRRRSIPASRSVSTDPSSGAAASNGGVPICHAPAESAGVYSMFISNSVAFSWPHHPASAGVSPWWRSATNSAPIEPGPAHSPDIPPFSAPDFTRKASINAYTGVQNAGGPPHPSGKILNHSGRGIA